MADEDAEVVIDLWDDVVMAAVREVLQRLRVANPGMVVDTNREASRVSVQVMVRFIGTDLQAREEPQALDVPVLHYAGGGYGAWMDMRADDPVAVVCCDGPVRGYYETGSIVTPQIGQGHDYGSAVAFPGGRVSATDQPTAPPNAPGEFLVGAADGSATVTFRGAGLTDPSEMGTVVVQGKAEFFPVRLGGPDAVLGVGRIGDPVAASVDLATVLSSLAAFVNGLAPGTVNPATLAQALVEIGTISKGSTTVAST